MSFKPSWINDAIFPIISIRGQQSFQTGVDNSILTFYLTINYWFTLLKELKILSVSLQPKIPTIEKAFQY